MKLKRWLVFLHNSIAGTHWLPSGPVASSESLRASMTVNVTKW